MLLGNSILGQGATGADALRQEPAVVQAHWETGGQRDLGPEMLLWRSQFRTQCFASTALADGWQRL